MIIALLKGTSSNAMQSESEFNSAQISETVKQKKQAIKPGFSYALLLVSLLPLVLLLSS